MAKENKKIKNAHPLFYDGIQFKSQLEKMIYATLKANDFPVKYEPEKITVWKGILTDVPFYSKCKIPGMLKRQAKKLLDITYTPDFIFDYNGYKIVVEAKGFANSVYPIKRKLFRAWLEEHPKSIYFEIYTKGQLLQAIEMIKNLKQDAE